MTSKWINQKLLARIPKLVDEFIDRGLYASLSTLGTRDGEVLWEHAAGVLELGLPAPRELDSIVRVYSMTKIVVSVAGLQLIEAGTLDLADPVSAILPEFQDTPVWVGPTSSDVRPPAEPIRILDLFRHTAGMPYPDPGSPTYPLTEAARTNESVSLADLVLRVATIPLAEDPGIRFNYGFATDVLGRVIEVVTGKSLEEHLKQQIFDPLDMKDTAYSVPEKKMSRLAMVHEGGGNTPLRVVPVCAGEVVKGTWRHPAGGSGLYSTQDDYAKFGLLLCNGGKKDLLRPATFALFTANHLSGMAKPFDTFEPGCGFGLGVEIRLSLGGADRLQSIGDFGWNGKATTFFRKSPQTGIVTIILGQHLPQDEHRVFNRINNLAMAALE